MNDGARGTRSTVPEATGRVSVSADKDGGWTLLPGLFSWNEVCSLFDAGSGRDREWRFSVRRVSTDEKVGPLYAVRAAFGRSRDEGGSDR